MSTAKPGTSRSSSAASDDPANQRATSVPNIKPSARCTPAGPPNHPPSRTRLKNTNRPATGTPTVECDAVTAPCSAGWVTARPRTCSRSITLCAVAPRPPPDMAGRPNRPGAGPVPRHPRPAGVHSQSLPLVNDPNKRTRQQGIVQVVPHAPAAPAQAAIETHRSTRPAAEIRQKKSPDVLGLALEERLHRTPKLRPDRRQRRPRRRRQAVRDRPRPRHPPPQQVPPGHHAPPP